MRSADAVTLLRVLIIAGVAYLILAKYNPIAIALIIAFAMFLDGVDGYLAVSEASEGKVGFGMYLSAALGNKANHDAVKRYKMKASKLSRYGARIDVAGDRAVEYILWVTYTFVNIIPLFVLFIVIIRHSFADAVLGAKGTSSKMKTKFAQIVYSSNLFRGGLNAMKFVTFSYLAFVYSWSYPLMIGQWFVAILVTLILLRGAAEIYEAYN